jgi:hypothetical protein
MLNLVRHGDVCVRRRFSTENEKQSMAVKTSS